MFAKILAEFAVPKKRGRKPRALLDGPITLKEWQMLRLSELVRAAETFARQYVLAECPTIVTGEFVHEAIEDIKRRVAMVRNGNNDMCPKQPEAKNVR